jgi:hypothetical protein
MNLPPEVFSADLSSAEFKTLMALYALSDGDVVRATTVELATLTGYSTETLRRAFRGLEEKQLLLITRTKRNLGKHYFNVYRLLLQAHDTPHKAVGCTEQLEAEEQSSTPHSLVGSTGGQVPLQVIATRTEVTSSRSKTRYARLTRRRSAPPREEGTTLMVNRWHDEDEGLAGVGFLDEGGNTAPPPKKPKAQPPSQRTAAEFSRLLKEKNPYTPGLVNVRTLSQVFARYRREHSVPYEVEAVLPQLFVEDNHNWNDLERLTAKQVTGRILNFYRNNLRAAYLTAGVEYPETGSTAAEAKPEESFIYATDGTPFPDTSNGRRARDRFNDHLENQ